MKSFPRKCALAALLSTFLAGAAQAQLNPYGFGHGYSTTTATQPRYEQPTQVPSSYTANYDYVSGPELTSANSAGDDTKSVLTSLIGNPPTKAPETLSYDKHPVTPLGDYGQTHWETDQYGYPPPDFGGSGWFGSISGLLMTRDRGNHYFFSYERSNEANQLTDARRADIQWGGGFDVRLGHYFNCGQSAVQGVYWGVYPRTAFHEQTNDGLSQLDAILNYSQLDYNGGPANLFTDDAMIHHLRRDNEFHNIELNLLHLVGGCSTGSCGPFSYNLLAGVRFFRFQDNLLFIADTVDRQFTGAPEELHYNINLKNNLIGGQIGAEGRFCPTRRLAFDFGTKIGLFANHVQHTSAIGGAAGLAVINNGPNAGRQWLVDNTKDDVAFLAEANLGARYNVTDCWNLFVGYRAVAVTGVALPVAQIYHDLRGIQDVEQVNSNGSLILHGGYFGVEYTF